MSEVNVKNLGVDVINVGSYNGKGYREANNTLPQATDNEVYDRDATSITLDPATAEIVVNEELHLEIVPSPDITNAPNVVWESSDEEVAIVTDKGVVVGKKIGEATITATDVENTEVTTTASVSVVAVVTTTTTTTTTTVVPDTTTTTTTVVPDTEA